MKLARVWLSFPLQLPGMSEPRVELTEDDCADAGFKEMRYDAGMASLVIGPYGVAWHKVVRWEGSDLELECQKCGKTFKSGQALGGHRSRCEGKKAA